MLGACAAETILAFPGCQEIYQGLHLFQPLIGPTPDKDGNPVSKATNWSSVSQSQQSHPHSCSLVYLLGLSPLGHSLEAQGQSP